MTSSNGEAELHYLNWTSVKIGAVGLPMEVTLTNRDTMPRRMLLEREAISNDMIANQNKTFPQNKLSFTFYDQLKKSRPVCRTLRIHLLNPKRSNCVRLRLDNVVEERGTSVTPYGMAVF